MSEEWMVRVEGKEYGPVDLDELREWKREGRLIRENEVRESGGERWILASELPEIFADEREVVARQLAPAEPASLPQILSRTWQVYRHGFWTFLGLSALAVVPSLCAQLTTATVGTPTDLNLRTALAGLFNFAMLMASLFAWPLYIAGIQIASAEIAQGRSPVLSEIIPPALKAWPRVAGLCVFVYLVFFLITLFGFAILLLVATGTPSLALALVSLVLLFLQVWIFGRAFVNFLYWQQPAVLEETGLLESLKRSKELARSRRELPWWRRPLWLGAFLSSIWFLVAFLLSLGAEWSQLVSYFNILNTQRDPAAIMQAMSAAAKSAEFSPWSLGLGLVQAILRPLLGISFVLVYLDLTGTRIFPANEQPARVEQVSSD